MEDSICDAIESVTGVLPDEWRTAFAAVPRARFLPDVIWLRGDGGAHEPCDRRTEPERWSRAVHADRPVVVQVRDGDGREAQGGDPWPSSSASQPSVVAGMLLDLDLDDGMRVLEIGTGTGWNAGLLAHRLGGESVCSVEVDRGLAEMARGSLSRVGLNPTVVEGDGALGYAAGAPYDRIVVTCSVSRVPVSWLEQAREGARIVVPWSTSWMTCGTAILHKRADGSASGLFREGGSFMPMRSQRFAVQGIDDVLRVEDRPEGRRTTLSPWAVAGRDDSEADFAVGLRVPDVWHCWDHEPEAEGVGTRLWLGDEAGTSWASVDYDGRLHGFQVRQHGPRRLWDEVEAAWAWWVAAGSPLPDRFGLTVRPNGQHSVRLDREATPVWDG